MNKKILLFSEIDDIVKWLTDNSSAYTKVLILSSAYSRSKQIINKLGEAWVPYVEIFRHASHNVIEINCRVIEAHPISAAKNLYGNVYDLVIIHDPQSIPAEVLKEVLCVLL